MTDYEDYDNNLAFPPHGDWSDTQPKCCTDRTPQVVALIDRVANLEEEKKEIKDLLYAALLVLKAGEKALNTKFKTVKRIEKYFNRGAK